MSNSVRPHRWQPTRLPRPWDSPGKNTGVGCYFLLQCMKVKSESEVAQSCLTLRDPMDCSPPGSSLRPWGFPGRNTGVGCYCLLRIIIILIFKSSRPCIHRLRPWSCNLIESESEVAQSCPTFCEPTDCSLPGSSVHGIFQARMLEWVAISFSRRSSRPRDWTWVSCIVGRRFTLWATREVSTQL